jgi:hypothetical protein
MNTETATTAVVDPAANSLDGIMQLLSGAYGANDWVLLSGLLLACVVIGLRRLPWFKDLPKRYKKWQALTIAILSSIAVGLQTGQEWLSIIVTGLAVGLAAIGGWEAIWEPLRDLARAKGWLKSADAKPTEKPAE